MKDRLKLLTTSRNLAPPARQQTLRAAREWSHGFLEEREQPVFRRLAVMANSVSLELVQQVLAVMTIVKTNTAPRYWLLDSPRAYALERLAAAGELDMLRQRHALAMAALFDAAWDEPFSGNIGDDDWKRKMSADLDNARDALAWASAADDAASGLAIGATLMRALRMSLYGERRALADRCVALIEPAHRLLLGADAAGLVANLQGNPADALLHTRRALVMDRIRGRRFSSSHINLIDFELAAGHPDAAARIGTELVVALERTRDEQGLTFAQVNLTAAWLVLNELESARLVAQAGWPQAVRFDLHQMLADHLALLAALDGRPQDAARISGYADATYAALEDMRQVNEAAAGRARPCLGTGGARRGRVRAPAC